MRPTLPSTREVIPETSRPRFDFRIPTHDQSVIAGHTNMTYAEWEAYHKELGQELAKRIRKEA